MKNLAFLRGKTVLQYTSKIPYNIEDVLGVTWGLTQVVEEEGILPSKLPACSKPNNPEQSFESAVPYYSSESVHRG